MRAGGRPAVFTIPAETAFVDALARGILDDTAADPLALAAITVLLPTRRACRSLREAFLRLSDGKPLLLPRLMPLNDVDDEEALFSTYSVSETADIPPPISALKRQLMLTRAIQALPEGHGARAPDQAIRLAQELAKFLDEVQTERLSFENLKNLAPERFAQHWQDTLRFMEILTAVWPGILAGEGAVDPAQHRNQVFAAQIAAWKAGAARGPIIAAGSTGSIPATADVLSTIAHMPDACVVLPGLDAHLNDEDWAAVDDTHPQHGLKQLLAHIAIDRDAVAVWPKSETTGRRASFLSEVMRPAATTHAWQRLPPFDASVVDGLSRIDCVSPREEAEVVALIMREALEQPGQTCALVTPDRNLAERVTAELKRWAIEVDDSAGRPLHQTPPGAFLRLIAAMVAADFSPVPTLAACKYPLAAGGRDPGAFRALTRLAELEILRGPLPPAGLDGLAQLNAQPDHVKDVKSWLALLTASCGAFSGLMKQPQATLSALLSAHMEAAETLAATPDTPGPLRLWAEDAGEAAAKFIAELTQCADTLPPIAPVLYPAILEALMDAQVVRPRYGKHPRLHILGPLEARLQRFDVLILSGLNEGTWPAAAPADPWMSRPMRAAFGLPLPERRIGQAAHDIAQALCGPRVILTRAKKVEGTPTIPSRWLMRLERVAEAVGLSGALQNKSDWGAWARELTQPKAFASTLPPAPQPPVSARPRKLSVTAIERWMRDPYSIYAQYILKLVPLDPLEQDAGAADYGTLIHEALRQFIEKYPSGRLPSDARAQLHEMGRDVFAAQAVRPSVMAFWWPRFERIAAWFVDFEAARRGEIAHSYVEMRGEMTLQVPGGAFTLSATADRIDRTHDGKWIVLDYKTGSPPKDSEVINGFSPQLPLEAAILTAGGFAKLPAGPIASLSFWHLHGRGEGGNEKTVKDDATKLAGEAREGLINLITKFDDAKTPYEARPNPEYAPKYSDYEHLARVKEWSSGGDDGAAS